MSRSRALLQVREAERKAPPWRKPNQRELDDMLDPCRRPRSLDVRVIRLRTGLSQVAFAKRYGFSPAALRDWEQGRRRPEQGARTLLLVIDREPKAVERVIEAA